MKGKNNPMTLTSSWVFIGFYERANASRRYVYKLGMYFHSFQKESTMSGAMAVSQKQGRRGGGFPEVSCFFGQELFLLRKNTLSTRKHLPILYELKNCRARKIILLCGFKLCLCLLFCVVLFCFPCNAPLTLNFMVVYNHLSFEYKHKFPSFKLLSF